MLRAEDRGPVRWMTLDRPGHRNALPPEGWERLAEALAAFERSDLAVLVLTGADGEFCGGLDLSGHPSDRWTDRRGAVERVQRAALALHRLTKPVVAAVDGLAAGAGLGLALGSDVAVATGRARLEAAPGEVGGGSTWLLPRVVGLSRARELLLTGRPVGAEEARRLGLVAEVVETDELSGRVQELAEELASGDPLARSLVKRALLVAGGVAFEQAVAHETQIVSLCLWADGRREGGRS